MAPPRPPPELVEDAVAEILLRLPPDDPASLVRATLVCKRWRRAAADPAFPRRYRSFHRTPPLLGFLRNVFDGDLSIFVPTTSFRPRGHGFPGGVAVDCRHGRALLLDYTSFLRDGRVGILVWDPVTGDRTILRNPDVPLPHRSAAVLCAADGCAHLGGSCHGGPFIVVFVGNDYRCHFGTVAKACVYASQTGAWSKPASIQLSPGDIILQRSSLLIGEELYFFRMQDILWYDLGGHRLSAIDLPARYYSNMTLIEAEGGGLGLAGLKGRSLYLWCREGSPDGVDRWVQSRVIMLDSLTTSELFYDPLYPPLLVGYAEGTDIVFMSTGIGKYMFDLKSMQVKKIDEANNSHGDVFPYMSFYIPDCARGELASLVTAQQ